MDIILHSFNKYTGSLNNTRVERANGSQNSICDFWLHKTLITNSLRLPGSLTDDVNPVTLGHTMTLERLCNLFSLERLSPFMKWG